MRMRRVVHQVGLIMICLLALLVGVADAQGKKSTGPGGIKGGVCPGAALVYIPGRSFVAFTGPDGTFELSSVPPGTYTLHVEVSDPTQVHEQQVTVLAGQVIDVGSIPFTDLNTDPNHCGSCGNACSAGQACAAGACVSPPCTDLDGDGFYKEAGCGTPVDCDDNDASVNPGAVEICGDSIDNNCNGTTDENC